MAGAGAPVVGRRARDRRRLGETAEAARPLPPTWCRADDAAGLRPGMGGWPVAVRAGARHSRTAPRFGHARVRRAVRDDLVAGRVVVLPQRRRGLGRRAVRRLSGLRRELRRLVGLLELDQAGLAVGAGRAGRGEQERLRGRRLIVSTFPVGGVGRARPALLTVRYATTAWMAARKATLVVTVPRRQSGACAVSRKKTGREAAPVSSRRVGSPPVGDSRATSRPRGSTVPARQPPAALTAPVGHAPPLAKARSSDELPVVAADGHCAARREIVRHRRVPCGIPRQPVR